MREACLVCEGSGRGPEGAAPCPYCQGCGRVEVRTLGPRTVLLATGSCRLPLRKVTLEGGLKLERHHVPAP